jgi:prepilin-type N-terminal cleavage/methylation domain-containing protein
MCSRQHGFSLIESLVAMLVALTIVASVGILGMRLTHRRSSSASISAATSVAEKAIESLRPLTPAAGVANRDQTQDVDELGNVSVGGPYRRRLLVENGPLAVGGVQKMKRATVTVWHVTNPEVRVELVTYFRVDS